MEESKRIKLVFELPLRNRNKEIIAYTKVDEDDYEKFKDLRLSLTPDGYAKNFILIK
jgi:hypothetical protein